MFRNLLRWLNGGDPSSHTEPMSRLDRLDGLRNRGEDFWSDDPMMRTLHDIDGGTLRYTDTGSPAPVVRVP